MNISIEALTAILTIATTFAMGLAKILEALIIKLFKVATGQKGQLESIGDLVNKATTNHLSHIQNSVDEFAKGQAVLIEQGKQNFQQHEKTIELLAEIKGKLSK